MDRETKERTIATARALGTIARAAFAPIGDSNATTDYYYHDDYNDDLIGMESSLYVCTSTKGFPYVPGNDAYFGDYSDNHLSLRDKEHQQQILSPYYVTKNGQLYQYYTVTSFGPKLQKSF